ncbi:MAG: ABC transporter substrate-binding protein [Taibaiella sp.]|nr:ABC transporter substrate-binding protein [Taibaiella sp.]
MFFKLPKIVACSFTLLLFGLHSCKEKERPISEEHTFFYNQTGGLESLDPAFAKSLAIMWQVHMIYNTLIEIDTSLNIVPSLAYRYEIDSGGLVYRFFLHNHVYFQDHDAFPDGKGRKMTAADVVYSFRRIIDPEVASPGAWIFNGKVAAEEPFRAVNDTIVEIRLAAPFAPFLELLSMQYCSIVPQEAVMKYGTDFRNHPCGTGPFQMVRWDEGNALILHKNGHYWERDEQGKPLPYLDAVKVSFNESKAMEYLMIKEGKLDFINGIDGLIKDLVLTKKGTLKPEVEAFLTLRKRPYLNTEYLGILMDSNLQVNPALRLRKVRHAIDMGINKQKIVTYFRNGIGIPAYQGFTPGYMPGMKDRGFKSEFDPDRAARLIREVKDSTGWPVITLEIATPEALGDMCNFIAQQLIEIGIAARVQVYQPGMMRQLMSQGQVSCFKAQWIADYPDAETYLAYFYSSLPAPPNYTRFHHPLFDRYYHEAIQTEDPQVREQKYRLMDSIAAQQYAVIPLFYDELMSFMHKDVQGMSVNPMNIIDIKRVTKSRD